MKTRIRGGAVVEMLLILPLLTLIVVGCIRFWLAAWIDADYSQLARPGQSEKFPAHVQVELAVISPWAAAPGRASAQLHLEEWWWIKNKNSWKELNVVYEEK